MRRSKKPTSSDLRHRVTIEKVTVGQDDYGGKTESWQTHKTVWAAIEPLRGREYFEARQANSEVAGKVIIRYRSDIEPTMRVKFGERILTIDSIIHPLERKQFLELLYKEDLDQ